ncbi:hypothetical protein [Conexibacter sp. CPCC 206217]|uniref:hypothetical protein n=1 Tax=Conexibacter sp. CPCC 206217 TaxID=3064574 RepID=UPI0027290CF0|nr:hypothetical protein [Conexibacter sp. CPCC 206217]MDO8209845.1 hypothetical protein [Conexibacter sp. CPCC 206217]
MSHTRAGLLYVLPEATETAVLLPGAEEWREPLEEGGVRVVEGETPQVAIAPAERAAEVVATGAPSAILFGRGDLKALQQAGYSVQRYLPVPSLAEPSVLIPLAYGGAARYALANLSVPAGLVKRLRNVVAGLAISAKAPLPGSVAVATRPAGLPFPVRTGQQLGLPPRLDWVLMLGRARERSAYFLFKPGASKPSWVLKFSPNHSDPDPFLSDKRGHDLIADVGGAITQHTPSLVGISVDGPRPLTVETAALGAPLVYWLRSSGNAARKRAVVEAVARWLIQISKESAVPGGIAEPLAALGFPEGIVEETGADVAVLKARVVGVPAVVEHKDLDPTHVLVDGSAFNVIDWEEAQRHGLPLADLAFFLAQALPILDGELDDPAIGRRDAFARLFRGDSASAPLLFQLVREGCDALGLAPETVGPLLSLTWLRLSTGPRRHLAEVWFADPRLGPSWDAWS